MVSLAKLRFSETETPGMMGRNARNWGYVYIYIYVCEVIDVVPL